MMQRFFAWVQRYERHLSALAMVTGFVVDNIFFDRVDLLQTHLVFSVYTAICFITIPLLHWLETSWAQPPRGSARGEESGCGILYEMSSNKLV